MTSYSESETVITKTKPVEYTTETTKTVTVPISMYLLRHEVIHKLVLITSRNSQNIIDSHSLNFDQDIHNDDRQGRRPDQLVYLHELEAVHQHNHQDWREVHHQGWLLRLSCYT